MDPVYERLRGAVRDRDLPALVVDLDALDQNARVLLRAGADRPIRIATKSIRVPAVLRHLLAFDPRLRGLMTWSAAETTLLADQGFDDLLLGYPVVLPADARRIAELRARGVTAVAMVDDDAQGAALARAADAAGVTVPIALDIDASLHAGSIHLGVRRSPLRDPASALNLARRQRDRGLLVVGIMAYEAQVAGLPDRVPGQGHLAGVRRAIKAASVPLAASRRAAVVSALRDDGFEIRLVNGGGTGSLTSTRLDPTVTELTAGSGFFAPHLFDGYRDLPLSPAAVFALPVVRRSDPRFVCCAGGGWLASGPAGPDRAPRLWRPLGLEPVGLEGWGEVQTPLTGPTADRLALGDAVFARHAKAGELAEHFRCALLLRGDRIVDEVPTLRGLGSPWG